MNCIKMESEKKQAGDVTPLKIVASFALPLQTIISIGLCFMETKIQHRDRAYHTLCHRLLEIIPGIVIR